jgi:tetratricopeptide (TPR) repeat protein
VANKVNRALLLARLNRLDEALESIDGALELEPSNPAIHHNKATILLRNRRHGEALLSYLNASSSDPSFPVSFWPAILLLGGHFDRPLEALEMVNRLIAIEPDPLAPNPLALFVRGCLLAKLGRTLEARFWIRQARERGGALPLAADPSGTRRPAIDFLGLAPG